jgi:tRNA U38,U39,U40 pseudouridine synthase TruA
MFFVVSFSIFCLSYCSSSIQISSKLRYVSRVMYDGSSFRGWQDQDKKFRTVQGTLHLRFSERFGYEMRVTGASR